MYLFEAKLNLLAITSTPDIAEYHLEYNLNVSCLRCWSTGLNEREISMQYYTSTKMYVNKCTEIKVCNDCTYRPYRISDVLSEDTRSTIYFCFKTSNTLQDNMSRIIKIVMFTVYLHTRKRS